MAVAAVPAHFPVVVTHDNMVLVGLLVQPKHGVHVLALARTLDNPQNVGALGSRDDINRSG